MCPSLSKRNTGILALGIGIILGTTRASAADPSINGQEMPKLALSWFAGLSTHKKALMISTLTMLISPWTYYKLHLKNVDMNKQTKQSPKNIKGKIQQCIYFLMSYLAHQDEDGKWKGVLPEIDNKLIDIKDTMKSFKERLDVINFFGTLSYMICTGTITFNAYKFLTESLK